MGRDLNSAQLTRAIAAVDRHGVLLVYPVQNKREPLSLWHLLHPKTPMRWAWDEDADPRVSAMWRLRERLARDRRVVYSKWLGGRATFISCALFRSMLSALRIGGELGPDLRGDLSADATSLIEILQDDSPQSTRALRQNAGLEGRLHEAAFTRAMRELWQRLLIVGVGEVETGGFPALNVGATELLREDLWSSDDSYAELQRVLGKSPPFARAWQRIHWNLTQSMTWIS